MTAGRNPVSVVMPFAGSADEALAAVESLGRLHLLDGDQLLLADNAGVLANAHAASTELRAASGVAVTIIAAARERSPAHARNAGAAAARPGSEWILFLDADTSPPPDLIDRYFAEPIAGDIGALAGGIRPAPPVAGGGRAGLVARYGAHKNFLDAGAHLAHPFMPRAAAANLLVRRAAFEAVGGFFEGLRAAEDTDFSWRLQLAGWRLVARPGAAVEHRYRDSIAELRRQWRSYAAGRAWLGRRYDGFRPQPALLRAARRTVASARGASRSPTPPVQSLPTTTPTAAPLPTRAVFAALDALLGIEELIGFTQGNRPLGSPPGSASDSAHRVLVVDRFPAPDVTADPGALVEAAARPERTEARHEVTVTYREDDGLAERAAALIRLAVQAPGATAAALADDAHATASLAPAARRLRADPDATLTAARAADAETVQRLERLCGRSARP
jgi:GT2 family glycosyltransferase